MPKGDNIMSRHALKELKNELHVSHSQIFTYLNCSLKYLFSYVEARKAERLSVALPFGSAIHTVMERYYRSLMNGGIAESLEALEDVFTESFSLAVDEANVPIIYKKDAPDNASVIAMGKGMLKAFYETVDLDGMRIVDAELPLSATLYDENGLDQGIRLVGVIDLLLMNEAGELIVIDHKTAAQKKSQTAVDDDSQMTAYSYLLASNKYMFPTAPVQCRFDVLRKLKTPKMEFYHTVRTAADRKRFAKVASCVLAAIEKRVFIPQKSWMCTDCQYANACAAW
jgi:putative RecB family exonuclease